MFLGDLFAEAQIVGGWVGCLRCVVTLFQEMLHISLRGRLNAEIYRRRAGGESLHAPPFGLPVFGASTRPPDLKDSHILTYVAMLKPAQYTCRVHMTAQPHMVDAG